MSEPQSSLAIILKRVDRVYRPNELVEGKVVVNAYKGWVHNGLKMVVEGAVHLTTTARGVGILDVMSSGIRPIQIIKEEFEVSNIKKNLI